MSLKLVVFDVDGTLVDSQAAIVGAMSQAFASLGRPAPARSDILSIVGLSLDHAMARLAPDLSRFDHETLVEGYKTAFMRAREDHGAAETAPLYPGASAVVEALAERPDMLLAIATGKSRRGLVHLLQAHDLSRHFVSCQVADDHPSKPHPSMLLTILSETGLQPEDAVMIGDTTYDMHMAQSARMPFFGVTWGYHPPSAFTSATNVLTEFETLPGALDDHWGSAQ